MHIIKRVALFPLCHRCRPLLYIVCYVNAEPMPSDVQRPGERSIRKHIFRKSAFRLDSAIINNYTRSCLRNWIIALLTQILSTLDRLDDPKNSSFHYSHPNPNRHLGEHVFLNISQTVQPTTKIVITIFIDNQITYNIYPKLFSIKLIPSELQSVIYYSNIPTFR